MNKKKYGKIFFYLVGTNENNKKEVDVWLYNTTYENVRAKAETMWLSDDGEIWVYMWYCGYGENKKFKELPNRWQNDIFDEMVMTRRIEKD
jgi:hypothetical protein